MSPFLGKYWYKGKVFSPEQCCNMQLLNSSVMACIGWWLCKGKSAATALMVGVCEPVLIQ